ncbi:hypothetical protein DFH08DRAFT_384308 [Mycena albidolilacea]|uniref:Uncharacterized protein n=1 Tax=Mycena albidolilacea TaxID=1033008 RepID=A0AAD6ZGF8_9AGAR|nr:hypothetical protein DFH08DRAFT_384308 [Mycena albidolilacea]
MPRADLEDGAKEEEDISARMARAWMSSPPSAFARASIAYSPSRPRRRGRRGGGPAPPRGRPHSPCPRPARSRCCSRSCSCSLCLSRSRSCATSSSSACSSFRRACHSQNDTLATGGGAGMTTGGGDGSRGSAGGAGGSDETDAAVTYTGQGGCTVIGDTAFSFSPDGISGSTRTYTASSSARTRGGMSSWTSGSSSDFGAGLGLAGEDLYGSSSPTAKSSASSSCSRSSARDGLDEADARRWIHVGRWHHLRLSQCRSAGDCVRRGKHLHSHCAG